MGIANSRPLSPPHTTQHKKNSKLLFNLIPLPHLPHIYHHYRGRKKCCNTTKTLQALTHLRNVMTATTVMLNTPHHALSPERDPELRARFVNFLARAEDFYVRGCEECVKYNRATGWYDVDHLKVARGVDAILSEFLVHTGCLVGFIDLLIYQLKALTGACILNLLIVG